MNDFLTIWLIAMVITTGLSQQFKVKYHKDYFVEILTSNNDKYSFWFDFSNTASGQPLWQGRRNGKYNSVPRSMSIFLEFQYPIFIKQSNAVKTEVALKLEKKIYVSLVIFYISLISLVISAGYLITNQQ